MASTYLRRVKRTWRKDDGSGTIEMLIWMPIFVFMFVMISDASFIFYGKSQMMRITQDANRALSVGAIESELELEARVIDQLQTWGQTGVVDAVINSTTGIVTTTLSIPANDLTSVGSIPALRDFDVIVITSHFLEQ